MSDKKDDLELTKGFFDFLRGIVPDGYTIKKDHVPKLTADQAWTVIWYLGNLYWQVTDHIERCEVCGTIFDRHCSGDCLDYGRGPTLFCDDCMNTEPYVKKSKRNPLEDK